MRFHHSTRRGRNRLNQHHLSAHNSLGVAGHRALHHSNTSTSRWSQLAFCRDTNIHFNRRLPIEPPDTTSSAQNSDLTLESRNNQASDDLNLSELRLSEQSSNSNSNSNSNIKNRCSIKEEKSETMDMETARAKLVAQVEKHPFWSSKAARRMQLTKVDERRVFIYELTSFCERRELEWRFEPYKGGLVNAVPFRRLGSANNCAAQLSNECRTRQEKKKVGTCNDSGHLYNLNNNMLCVPNSNRSIHRASTPPAPLTKLTAPSSADSFWSRSSVSRASSQRKRIQASASRPSSSSMRRSFSSGSNRSSSLASASLTPTSNVMYEPVSVIEHKQTPSREFVWSIEPTTRQNGQRRPDAFVSHVHTLELPNSSFVKRCHGCQGRGRLKCASCYGAGYEVCISCSGKGTTKSLCSSLSSSLSRTSNRYSSSSAGYNSRNSTYANGYDQDAAYYSPDSSCTEHRRGYEPGGITGGSTGASSSAWVTESCHFCHGAGQKRCWVCAGKSYNHCLGCSGAGQLRCYLNLNITWLNHRDEVVLNNNDNIIPKDRLRLSTGLLLLDELDDKLGALQPTRIDGAIVASASNQKQANDESTQLHLASKRLLDKHKQAYKQEKLIKQRHKVTQIAAHVVHYEWKQRRGHFVIYGDEKKVYIAKYPFKSLCNIT